MAKLTESMLRRMVRQELTGKLKEGFTDAPLNKYQDLQTSVDVLNELHNELEMSNALTPQQSKDFVEALNYITFKVLPTFDADEGM